VWDSGGSLLRVTPEIVQGLSWLRGVAVPSTVVATNVPGAALYASLCECAEYYQTEEYAPGVRRGQAGGHNHNGLLGAGTTSGKPGSTGRRAAVVALRKAGITYLIVDRVNGFPIPVAGMPKPAFMDRDIAIYRI